jgi:hypothetical protein
VPVFGGIGGRRGNLRGGAHYLFFVVEGFGAGFGVAEVAALVAG